MRKFDTKVQDLKYKVLCEVAKQAWAGRDSFSVFNDIAKEIVKPNEPTMRCCIYKERAIVAERIKIATGGNPKNQNIIEIIDIACDECPVAGYVVTDLCRGCIAHQCENVCKRNAITFDSNLKATIDKSKCVECGKCASVCPYSAINNFIRPCANACKVKAITVADSGAAKIDYEKCISCGACVRQCPFGAAVDKSFMMEVIDLLKYAPRKGDHVYAVIAPAIASQFNYAKPGQIVSGLRKMGFYEVWNAALGADMVAKMEAEDIVNTLEERGYMTTSCCPAFVQYIKKYMPAMEEYISHVASPMTVISKFIKEHDPNAKVVFIGPCMAKKAERQLDSVKDYVDVVITFEELQALLDSKDLDITAMDEEEYTDASSFGRSFARSGGVADAVIEALKEMGQEDFPLNPIACGGIDACKVALLKASKNALPNNLIEGMACDGGCINGAGCLTHNTKDRDVILNYAKDARHQTIQGAIDELLKE